MDGPNMATSQELTTEGEKYLAMIHEGWRGLNAVMAKAGDAPFDDDKCNKRFNRMKRQGIREERGAIEFHEDLTDCVKDGDPTVNFGGDK